MSSFQHPDVPAQEAQNVPMGWASPAHASDFFDSDASDDESDDTSSDSSGVDTPDDDSDLDDEEEINEYTEVNAVDSTQVVDGNTGASREASPDLTHLFDDAEQLDESNEFVNAPQNHDSDYNSLEQHEATHEASSSQQYPSINDTQAQLIKNAYQAFLNNPLARTHASGVQQNDPSQQRNVTINGVSHDYRTVPSLIRSLDYTQDQKYAILIQCPGSVLDRIFEDWVAAFGHLLSVPLPLPVNGQPVAVVQEALQSIPADAPQVQPAQQPLVQPSVQSPQVQQLQAQQHAVQQHAVQQSQVQQSPVQHLQVQQPQVQQHEPVNSPPAQPTQQSPFLANPQPLPPMPQALPPHLVQPVFQLATQLNFDFNDLNGSTYVPMNPEYDEPAPDLSAPAPIYPAFTGYFRSGAEARAYRRRTKFAPGNKTMAQDIERVRRHGREYWVRRIYNAMIDISDVADGEYSVHRLRITENVAFNPVDLEATAHKVFEKAIESHEHGYTKPMIYHKRVVRGKLADRSEYSVERRLARLCECFATQKATVDDAVRGGVTLALLCDNPDARGNTKFSNNIGNEKRGGRLQYAKVAEEKEKLRAEKKAEREAAKAIKDAERAAKKAAKEAAKQEREQLKQQREQQKQMKQQQQRAGQGRTN